MNTYRFSSCTSFTEKEISQLCELTLSAGASLPIDLRKYTKNVVKWGLNFGLLYKGDEKRWAGDKAGKIYIHTRFSVIDLPVYTLWKLIDPIIGERNGFSVTKQPGWENLNIYPVGNRFSTERDLSEIYRIMCKLAAFRFIIFQSAGSVWHIERLEANNWITDER